MRRPCVTRLPTYSAAATMLDPNCHSGPMLNCCTIGVRWFGSWMRHCTMALFTFSGASDVKPSAKVKAGRSLPELAEMAASTSCGRLGPSWLSEP